MSTVTLRIPDDKHERLKAMAKARQISVNKLLDELATIALTEYDAKTRFELLATQGNPAKGLELLDKLEKNANAHR